MFPPKAVSPSSSCWHPRLPQVRALCNPFSHLSRFMLPCLGCSVRETSGIRELGDEMRVPCTEVKYRWTDPAGARQPLPRTFLAVSGPTSTAVAPFGGPRAHPAAPRGAGHGLVIGAAKADHAVCKSDPVPSALCAFWFSRGTYVCTDSYIHT